MSINTQRLDSIGTAVAGTAGTHSHRHRPLTAALQRLRDRVILARRRRIAINELARLSDRELNDIGIQRGQIPYAVDAAFRREEDVRRAAGWKRS